MNLRSKNCSKNKYQIFWSYIPVNRDKMEICNRINSYSVISKLCVTHTAKFEANSAKKGKAAPLGNNTPSNRKERMLHSSEVFQW
jgi:hypothetical protein